jgi:hypothetical protein
MRPRTIATLTVLTLIGTAGCSRDFAAPPPEVGLSAIWPDAGFSGDEVVLCAARLAEVAADNEVLFGQVRAGDVSFHPPAGWQGPEPADFTCAAELLYARVPVLEREGATSVHLENATGRASLRRAFDYRGPGHPVAERVQKVLHLRAGLWSLFAPPGIPVPIFGAISQGADLLSLFETSTGLHLDFGQCALPLSGAVALTDFEFDLADPTSWVVKLKFFWVTAERVAAAGGDEQHFDLGLWAWDVDLNRLLYEKTLDPAEPVAMPATADGKPFRPALVWSIPRTGESLLHDIAVSHISRPALAIFSVEALDQPIVVDLSDRVPHCRSSPEQRLGPIADLVYDPSGQVFYAAVAEGNEIWRIARDGSAVGRAWPPPDPTGRADQIDCGWKNSALALRRSHGAAQHLRLYAADVQGARVRAMQPASDAGGAPILEPVPLQSITLDGLPYALTTARFDDAQGLTHEHLYAATQNGVVVIDVTASNPVILPGVHAFGRVGEIPLRSNQGSSQSLITSDNYSLLGQPDTVAVACAHDDRVRFYTAGAEEMLLLDVTIGATLPRLASASAGDRLFMTDALSNTIQVIDRRSGMRRGQFLIADLADHQLMGFGSTGMANLPEDDADLLLVPLLDLDLEHAPGVFEENANARYANLAFGRIGDALPACGITTSEMSVETAVSEPFHHMHLVRWDWEGRRDVPVLVLDRRAEEVRLVDVEGRPTGETVRYAPRTWCVEIDPQAVPEALLAAAAGPLCDLEPEVRVVRVRPARRAATIARLELDATDDQQQRQLLRLLPQDRGGKLATEGLVYPLAADFAPYVTDMVVLRGGTSDEPIDVVYLPLSSLGLILEVSFDLTRGAVRDAVIETGGSPSLLFTSPDGRRAYVTHPLEARLDVLRLDCAPDTDCRTLASTLDVSPFPFEVEFDASGRHAFVIHLFSNDVTVIE